MVKPGTSFRNSTTEWIYASGSLKVTYWYPSGQTKSVAHFIRTDGDLIYHKDDGPAFISYWENGQVKCEDYFQNGKPHRLDGRAWSIYNTKGALLYSLVAHDGVTLCELGDRAAALAQIR